jgi:MFS family permease
VNPAVVSLAALVPAYVFSIFFRGFLTVIAGALERDLGAGPRDLGAIGAAWFIAFAAAQFPVGYALDRFGPRRTVGGCMGLGVVGLALFAAAPSQGWAIAGMALCGLGCSPVFMGSLFILAKSVPPERFGPLTSLFIGLGSAGNLLGATPMALAVEAIGWRATMGGIAAAFAVSTLVVIALVRDPPASAASAGSHEGLWSGLRRIMSIPVLWIIMPLVLTGYSILATERGLWIGPFFASVHGWDVVSQGNAALVMAIAMTAGAMMFGLFERLAGGQKLAVASATAIVVVAFAALGWRGEASAFEALVWLTLIGAFGFSYGSLMAHGRLFFPDDLIGRGMTFVNFGFIAGTALIQLGSGFYIQRARDAGVDPAATYAGLHFGFAALLAVSLAIYLFAPARPTPAA